MSEGETTVEKTGLETDQTGDSASGQEQTYSEAFEGLTLTEIILSLGFAGIIVVPLAALILEVRFYTNPETYPIDTTSKKWRVMLLIAISTSIIQAVIYLYFLA